MDSPAALTGLHILTQQIGGCVTEKATYSTLVRADILQLLRCQIGLFCHLKTAHDLWNSAAENNLCRFGIGEDVELRTGRAVAVRCRAAHQQNAMQIIRQIRILAKRNGNICQGAERNQLQPSAMLFCRFIERIPRRKALRLTARLR